jgi:hypothetical protein
MNYGEVFNLLVILFITYSLLISMVIYVILEFLYRWKKIGSKKIIPRILLSVLSGPFFVLLYYFLMYYQSKNI